MLRLRVSMTPGDWKPQWSPALCHVRQSLFAVCLRLPLDFQPRTQSPLPQGHGEAKPNPSMHLAKIRRCFPGYTEQRVRQPSMLYDHTIQWRNS